MIVEMSSSSTERDGTSAELVMDLSEVEFEFAGSSFEANIYLKEVNS